jgi:RHS repeat-associated protein
LSQDHLGNTRLVTDEAGNTVARHDYRPFGEELIAGDGFRGAEWGKYDGVKQKFTGQEHDGETEFDFFHARYLSGAQQRFMSADPGNAGANPMNPQSWNAYAYVNNNPLSLVDPSGLDPFNPEDPGDFCWDDPFCGGWGDFPIFFPPIADSEPPIPSPPAPPAHEIIRNTTGVYAQSQWGSFLDKNGPNGNGPLFKVALGDPFWIINLLKIPYFDPFDRNHRLFGTHYCGPGGGGAANGHVDGACQAHDECYRAAGLDARVNTDASTQLTLPQASAAQACNQSLFDAVRQYPNEAGSSSIQIWLKYGDRLGILATGTAAK